MKQTLFIFLLLCSGKLWAIESVEQGIRLFNQKEYQQAQQIFQQQSEQGSAYATYWLGVTQYKNRQQFEAGRTFLKAAEMGSPWAMDVLAGNGNSPCKYLGWACDTAWTDKAIPLWEKQASQGNGKAMYQLILRGKPWWEIVPIYKYKKYKEIYSKAIPNGGYRFLASSVVWESTEEKMKYLKIAAKQGYAPAMLSLYYLLLEPETLDEALEWNNKAIKLGYARAARALFLAYDLGQKDTEGKQLIKANPRKAYFYNRISGALGGTEEPSIDITERMLIKDGSLVENEDGETMFEELINAKEQAELDKQVAEFVKDIKPNMFLDETSLELF
ncbi:sel1 repeat family protein [Vibrio sinaloensis]|uniref:sel1 repeat family protein n=1 Tax=Photobacterium sp. (strain ATCC 43367) TaxID=379097 RepID=UPI0022B06C19|nr:sel1 repeat family protein [Vibrio sinaloensis]MCZ4293982.1 sel1 repeat family protein [Vibrio sinaloensis]